MEIQTIGVAGAGKMGHGIALSAAMAGYPVVLHDRTDEDLARAKINIDNQIKKWIQKDVMTSLEGDKVKARIQPTTRFDDLAAMDLVIEVVPENLDLKMTILNSLMPYARTRRSSCPIHRPFPLPPSLQPHKDRNRWLVCIFLSHRQNWWRSPVVIIPVMRPSII